MKKSVFEEDMQEEEDEEEHGEEEESVNKFSITVYRLVNNVKEEKNVVSQLGKYLADSVMPCLKISSCIITESKHLLKI